MLLEVLIALLIFSLGVLGLVGLQANAVQQSGQAKYRADAALLADDLVGRMWVSDRSTTTLNTEFAEEDGAEYQAWKARVETTLPGVADNPPSIAFETVAPLPALLGSGTEGASTDLTASTRVTITLRWKAPSAATDDAPSQLVLVTEIK